MIYKKIGNKIPSLSALILAGMFLPGMKGCDKDSDPSPETGNNLINSDNALVDQSPLSDSGNNHNALKVYPKAYIDAFQKLFKFLLEKEPDLKYLQHKPVEVIPEDILASTDSKKVKEALESKCKELANPKNLLFLPERIREDFRKTFAGSKFQKFRSGSGVAGTKHKYAYGTAINRILEFFNSLHNQYTEFYSAITANTIDDQKFKKIDSELDQLLSKVDPSSPSKDFYSTTKFFDTSISKMLSDDQLVRFLTDKDQKNEKKLKGFISELGTKVLEDKIDVWVKIKQEDSLRVVNKDDMSRLNIRGAGIDESWKVKLGSKDKESENTMPKVDPFPNRGLEKRFDASALDFSTIPLTDTDSGDEERTLTGAQLLFTLFRGKTQGFDFFRLGKAKNLNCVEFCGDADSFKAVMEIANSTATDAEEKFAEFLYNHITNNIEKESADNKLFSIPDVQSLKNQILSGLDLANINYNNIAPNQGGSGSVSNSLVWGPTSVLGTVVDNIFGKIFSITINNLPDRENNIKKLQTLDLSNSTASFEHRIAQKIIKEILSKQSKYFATDIKQGTAQDLINIINETIDERYSESRHIIVYKKNNKHVLTVVGAKIRSWLKLIDEALSRKQKSTFITYKDFCYIDTNSNTTVGFDIDDLRKEMMRECKVLKNLLSAPVHSILQRKGKIDYPKEFPVIQDIVGSNTRPIDTIIDEYHHAMNNESSKG